MKTILFDNSALVALENRPNLIRTLKEQITSKSLRILVSPILFEETIGGLFSSNQQQINSSNSCIEFLSNYAHQGILIDPKELHLRAGIQAIERSGRINIFDETISTPVRELFLHLRHFSNEEKLKTSQESLGFRRNGTKKLNTWFDDFQNQIELDQRLGSAAFQKSFSSFAEQHLEPQFRAWNPVPGRWRISQIRRFFQSGIPTLRIIPLFIIFQLWARNQKKPQRRSIGMNDIRQIPYLPYVDFFISKDTDILKVSRSFLDPLPQIASRVIGIDQLDKIFSEPS